MLTGFVTQTSEFKKKFQGLLLIAAVLAPTVSVALDSDLESLNRTRWKLGFSGPAPLIEKIQVRAGDPKVRIELISQLNPIVKTTEFAYVKEAQQKLVVASELLKLPVEFKTLVDINQAVVVNFWNTAEVTKYFSTVIKERRDQMSLETLKYIVNHPAEFNLAISPNQLFTLVRDYYTRSLKAGTLTGKDALQLADVVWRNILRGNDFPGIRYVDIAEDPAFIFRHEILSKAAELDREDTVTYCKERFIRFLRYTKRDTFATNNFENGMTRSGWQEGQVYAEILAKSATDPEFSDLLSDISGEAERLMLDFELDPSSNKSPIYVFAGAVSGEMIRMLKAQRQL